MADRRTSCFALAWLPASLLAAAWLSPVQAQSAAGGEGVFKQRCAMCHTVKAGAPSGVGPNLFGLAKRASGGVKGFAYSPAVKAKALPWTKENLDRYLAAPGKVIPGTRMVVATADAKQRAALVSYLLMLK